MVIFLFMPAGTCPVFVNGHEAFPCVSGLLHSEAALHQNNCFKTCWKRTEERCSESNMFVGKQGAIRRQQGHKQPPL